MKTRVAIVALIVLLLAVAVAQSRRAPAQGAGMCRMCGSGDGVTGTAMTRRAEIRVVPLKLAEQDKSDIARMRQLAAELQGNRSWARLPDPMLKRQFELEDELLQLLNAHLERATTDAGKSERAIAVQARLNRMEGNMMCGACHGMGGGMAMRGAGGGR